jgi:hypothetical protein
MRFNAPPTGWGASSRLLGLLCGAHSSAAGSTDAFRLSAAAHAGSRAGDNEVTTRGGRPDGSTVDPHAAMVEKR